MFHRTCPSTDFLEDYILGHSVAAVHSDVQRHLLTCSVCRASLAEQQEFLHDLRMALGEVSAHDVALLTSLPVHERRDSARRRVARPISVLVMDECGDSRIEQGTLKDISESGAGLELKSEPRVGTALAFLAGSDLHSGIVRHVRWARFGYLCGMQFFRISDLRPR